MPDLTPDERLRDTVTYLLSAGYTAEDIDQAAKLLEGGAS